MPFDPVEQIRLDGNQFVKIVKDADVSTSVPGCPEWQLRDLAFHVGRVWQTYAGIVGDASNDAGDVRTIVRPAVPDDSDLVEFLHESLVSICDVLHAATPTTQVRTRNGALRTVEWVLRRMVHETALHLHDAAASVGQKNSMTPSIAADGIDEFLMWHAAAERRDGEMKVGGTVHLHCTDADLSEGSGEWFVSAMKEPAATFTREHRKGDAAIRGTAQDILLWLWRRPADIEIIGDRVVARRFQAFSDLA